MRKHTVLATAAVAALAAACAAPLGEVEDDGRTQRMIEEAATEDNTIAPFGSEASIEIVDEKINTPVGKKGTRED